MNTNIKSRDPILSIIVPVYNVEKYIKKCIESLLIQTLNNIEIIVVNDGTKDKSIEVVEKFNDSRIKIINKDNGGLSSARNVGINVAMGKYIAFVDSDDFIAFNNAYEEMINIANKYNSDIVVGNANRYYNDMKIVEMNKINSIFLKKITTGENYLINSISTKRIFAPVWLNLYKKDFIMNNNLYFKEGILHEDELFSPQIFLKANKVGLYDKNFYNYRQREGSIMYSSTNKEQRIKDMFNICLSLNEIKNTLSNDKSKMAVSNYISYLVLSVAYRYKAKVPQEIKNMIITNCNKKELKIKSCLLNINEKLYYLYEFVLEKIHHLFFLINKIYSL